MVKNMKIDFKTAGNLLLFASILFIVAAIFSYYESDKVLMYFSIPAAVIFLIIGVIMKLKDKSK